VNVTVRACAEWLLDLKVWQAMLLYLLTLPLGAFGAAAGVAAYTYAKKGIRR
jgi:hypothetical protein